MQAIDFNDGWSYRHLDAGESFTAVRLPHDAMIGEPRHEDAPGGVNTGWFTGSVPKKLFKTPSLFPFAPSGFR